jgi:hypothetical protein
MARIQFSGLISSIQGSISGGTLQKNRYGFSIRKKPIPANRRSANQTAVRTVISYLQGQWQSLTYDQRSSWNEFLNYSPTYSKNSRNRIISGHSLFLKYNSVRMFLGASPLLTFDYSITPNLLANPTFFRDSTTVPGVDSLFVYLGTSIDTVYSNFLLRASGAFTSNRSKAGTKARVCQTVQIDSEVFDLTASYLENFPELPALGSQIWAEVTLINMQCPTIYNKVVGAFEIFTGY